MPHDAKPTIPESHRDILESAGTAYIAAIGPRGEPQVSPVWFDWDGRYLRFTQVDAQQKYKNLQRDGRIAVSISPPDDLYRNVELRGDVVRVDGDLDGTFGDKLAKKYLGQDRHPCAPTNGEFLVVVVEPRHVRTYAAGWFAGSDKGETHGGV
jgi:PPOX class probable F420-dependent enzyme